MLITKKYLNEIVDLSEYNNEELEHKLSCYGGLEVETIYSLVEDRGYVVGKVVSLERHPEADKLSVCQVDLGSEVVQIVCGAPNVAENTHVIVAPIGTQMPGGMTIEAVELRGQASNGMICSLQEIGIEDKFVADKYKDGIFIFEEAVETGSNAIAALEMDTEVIELSITPNRSDCMSYRGVAYEAAAVLEKKMNFENLEIEQQYGDVAMDKYIQKLTLDTELVDTYHLLAFENLVIKPSPLWMQSFLISSNVRPISNVVDITNYVMLKLGLPLHAFDAKKVKDKEIIVRMAREGEIIQTLDLKDRILSPTDMLIATENKPIALAGVMGGSQTAVDEQTTAIILEAAIFDPTTVRKTANKFNLRSDASQRFEKGVDPVLPQLALALATDLLVKYANATVSSEELVATNQLREVKTITFTNQAVATKLGMEITNETIEAILLRLGFKVEMTKDTFTVEAPTRRLDINIFEDITDEVVRLYGYENVTNTLPVDEDRPVFLNKRDVFNDAIHQKLQGLGLQEILTYTLTSTENATFAEHGRSKLTKREIPHPQTKERSTLKTTTYHEMSKTLQYHINRNFNGVKLYEVTTLYGLEETRNVLSLGLFGRMNDQRLFEQNSDVDFFYIKGLIETVIPSKHLEYLVYQPSENTSFHPGLSSDIFYEKTFIGTIGKLHPKIALEKDLSKEMYLGELYLDVLFDIVGQDEIKYQQVSKFPDIERDVSFVVPSSLKLSELMSSIRNEAIEQLQDIDVFDIYTGDKLEDGKKAIALTLTFNDRQTTLKNEEIDKVVETIINNVVTQTGAVVRK